MTYKLLKDKTILVAKFDEFIGSNSSEGLFFRVINSIGILKTNFEERKNSSSLFLKLEVNNNISFISKKIKQLLNCNPYLILMFSIKVALHWY